MEKLTLTVKEAAEVSGIGRCKLEELIHSDSTFPYFRVGKRILINKALLAVWIENITLEKRVL